jgi:hypothetical protein
LLFSTVWGAKYTKAKQCAETFERICELHETKISKQIKYFEVPGESTFKMKGFLPQIGYSELDELSRTFLDFCENCSSCLSHIVCFLKEVDEGTPISECRGVDFPVFKVEPRSLSENKRFNSLVQGLKHHRVEYIRSIQPFHSADPERHILAILSAIRNMSVHRGYVRLCQPNNLKHKLVSRHVSPGGSQFGTTLSRFSTSYATQRISMGTKSGDLSPNFVHYWHPSFYCGGISVEDTRAFLSNVQQFFEESLFCHELMGDCFSYIPSQYRRDAQGNQ